MTPVSITQVQPLELHQVWEWVRGNAWSKGRPATGLERVIAKVKPDFIAEDVYAAIRFNNAQLYLVTRGDRRLGFFITYTQRRPFSNKLEYLVWIGYAVPLRERIPDGMFRLARNYDDDVTEAVKLSLDFMQNQARAMGALGPVMLSTRKGFEKYGFTSGFTTWSMSA